MPKVAEVVACPDSAVGDSTVVYRLRVVINGVSPLIWRRLLVPGATTIAELHTMLQTVFGWGGEHLHRFVIHGVEYGISYLGGPGFRDDARRVGLGELGLRAGERFTYEYNLTAGWQVDLRVEQIQPGEPGRVYPRCTGGRRAGPPEEWDGPWAFVEQTQPHRVFDAIVRTAEIMGQLLEADEDDMFILGEHRDKLAGQAAAVGPGALRPPSLQPSPGRTHHRDEGGRGMKLSVQVIVHPDDDGEDSPVVREVFALDRDGLAPDTLGLHLSEAQDLLVAVQDTMVAQQVQRAVAAQVACPHCGTARRHKDTRTIVVRSLFGTLRPRWWHCCCCDQPTRTFAPLAALLPERTTPELAHLQARFAGLISYGMSAKLLGELLPLGRRLRPAVVRRQVHAVAQRLENELGSTPVSSTPASATGRTCLARTCRWWSAWTAATSTPPPNAPAARAGSR